MPECGYCKDCKHWDTEAVAGEHLGCCQLTESSNGRADHKTLAVAQDYESYMAYLETSADFGCIQFEPKP